MSPPSGDTHTTSSKDGPRSSSTNFTHHSPYDPVPNSSSRIFLLMLKLELCKCQIVSKLGLGMLQVMECPNSPKATGSKPSVVTCKGFHFHLMHQELAPRCTLDLACWRQQQLVKGPRGRSLNPAKSLHHTNMSTVVAGHPSLYSHLSFATADKPAPAAAHITSPTRPSFSYKPQTCIIQSPLACRAPAVQLPRGKYGKSFNDILKHLISLEVDASATDAKIMSFNGVTAPEFKTIAHIVQESPLSLMKLNSWLTHDPQLSVIIVEWPKTNFLIQSLQTGFSGIPDLSLTLLAMVSPVKEVAACPEIVLIIMILIKEAQDYHSPVEGSVAWSQLSNQNWLDKDSFLRLRHSNVNSNESDSHLQGEHLTLKLVMVAKHCWCNIASIKYHVWVKSSSIEKIYINEHQMTSVIDCVPSDLNEWSGVKNQGGSIKSKQSIIAVIMHGTSLHGIKCSHSEDEEYKDEERDDSNTSTSSLTCLIPHDSPTPLIQLHIVRKLQDSCESPMTPIHIAHGPHTPQITNTRGKGLLYAGGFS
ncbi:hypothetical protein EDC04DRAFT_2612075 [Pisolithus marmoratus]|nr:hypothetical protein EDC04DRAFT_2612075 [Pisolithus marmoratus]